MRLSKIFTNGDLAQIADIYWRDHAEYLYIPSAENCVTLASAKEGERIIAFGMAKLFPEAILIIDKSATLRDRVQAFRMLMLHGIEATKEAGYKYLNATIHDETYGRMLAKHYGFKESPGKQVFLEL